TPVPTGDAAMHVLADDGIVGRLDNRGEEASRPFGFPLLGYVPKHQHDPSDVALAVPNRCAAVINASLRAVFGDQDGVVGQPDHHPVPDDLRDRTLDRLAGLLVDDAEDLPQGPTPRPVLPAGHGPGPPRHPRPPAPGPRS